ncbi:hypothetical protein C8J57DRAFT_1219872 [Mycena rebaudengoi]|nr:hypothetical protein C8J57DRAFT_1219872 [Mycena rebaudengoi]
MSLHVALALLVLPCGALVSPRAYAAPPTAQHAQQRPTLVIPSSTPNVTNSNSTPTFHTTAYHAAPYTSLGSAVTPSYSSVSTAHTPYSDGRAHSSGASGEWGTPYSPLERFGAMSLGGEREPAQQQQQEREQGRAGCNAYSTTGYATLSRERVYGRGAESRAGSPARW